jgi:hypothetical protein
MPYSFKFSIRHLLYALAAAAFVFWFVKNYYDSQKLAESQAQLRAAREAGGIYLYEHLLSDKNVIGKTPAEIPGLNELSLNPAKVDDQKLAELALQYGKLVRSAPATTAQAAGADAKSADSSRNPTLPYVSGDRVLYFHLNHGALLQEGSHTTGFFVYIRNGKILAILDHVTLVPS